MQLAMLASMVGEETAIPGVWLISFKRFFNRPQIGWPFFSSRVFFVVKPVLVASGHGIYGCILRGRT